MGSIAHKFGIPSSTTVMKWVNAYQTLGKDGVERKTKQSQYSVQFRLSVIEYMARTGESVQNIANKFGINNPPIITQWKKEIESRGMAALPKPKGYPPLFDNLKNQKKEKKLTREQELEREVELLKIENEYLKELRSLGINISN